MSEAELPDPTAVEGAPHPRDTGHLYGQSRAEADFLDAFNTGRLHHGWMLTGPRGVGKATLAWRIARFLLTQQGTARTLDTDPESPVARRIRAGAEPGVFVLKRGMNDRETALSQDIRVDEVRRLKSFLFLSAAEGGRRVVIVDAADEMNTQAANALLKLLEEPPERVTFLLVTHQPARLLPTIRSRCRELRLVPLAPGDMAQALAQAGIETEGDDTPALAALAAGSVGEAVRLIRLDGLEGYTRLVRLFATLPRLDRPQAIALAEQMAGKQNETRLDLMLGLIDTFLARLARSGVQGPPVPEAAPGESELFARLAPNAAAAMKWASLQQSLGARARHGRGVNLDPAALVMDMVLEMTTAAA
ncbi:DNA polymerase III subunit delta' [Paenirhodobacter populi]|uniref:DNA polymerase III subunit delta' n=1 Tax=Paenirhodobacter populi TaxID=2306993 RepID=UPI000FE42691|nr:DNA polymerase III subunit delta' [Sinirhodobacter populi]RWR09377.1 DNA polymerase III subunit delta' [Sinirhodobacter populi]